MSEIDELKRRIADLEAARDQTYYGQWLGEADAHEDTRRRIAAQEGDIQELRSLLWLNHGHRGALYGDDGELQCGFCGIDFKRMDPTEIRVTFIRRAVLDAAREKL